MAPVRMVVTGHDEAGKSTFIRDENVDLTSMGADGEFAMLWSSDAPATYPGSGEDPRAEGLLPPVGGVRVLRIVHLPNAAMTPEAFGIDGLRSEEGWHETDTTDFIYLISGQIALELEDGTEKVVSAGDVVVENGTNHRWRVIGDEPAHSVAFLVGANRA